MARHYLSFFERQQGRQNLSFSPGCEEAVAAHRWPGNLRELRNAVERAVILCPSSVIEASDLGIAPVPSRGSNADSAERVALGADVSLEDIEREHIARVVANAASFDAAAKTLGIDVTTLQRKRKKYGLA
jgi:NtrC-family two-component system response regulator AlgB